MPAVKVCPFILLVVPLGTRPIVQSLGRLNFNPVGLCKLGHPKDNDGTVICGSTDTKSRIYNNLNISSNKEGGKLFNNEYLSNNHSLSVAGCDP